jgi:transcriptional regulator with XRE-family HTH domain
MASTRLNLVREGLVPGLGRLIGRSRRLAGWTQRDLAARAGTSQATVWRIETGQPGPIDLTVVEGMFKALGLHAALDIDDLALQDRERQRDALHSPLNGYVARRLVRLGWQAPTEVMIGGESPRGWIDIAAYRDADRSMLVEETKCDLPDMGSLQRRLAFYAREAWAVAKELGWRPRRVAVLVVGLDTAALGARLLANRDTLEQAFPARVDAVAAWLADPAAPPPRGWGFALADPAVRGERWLRPLPVGGRRRPAAYEDYADAARRLLRSRAG